MTSRFDRLFLGSQPDPKDPRTRQRCGRRAGWFGLFCNLCLSVAKILVGVLFASLSITADGLNNLTDMGSSLITLIGFRLAGKPADPEHPYGHGRMEYLAAFMVAGLILLIGAELLISSVKALIAGTPAPVYRPLALVVLFVSLAVKAFMWAVNRHLGRLIDSAALAATATDCRNDCLTGFAILAGVVIGSLVRLPFNIDTVMGLLVSLFILYSGVNAAKETIDKLLGEAPDPETVRELSRIILSFEDFHGLHDLIIHNYGPGRTFASVHVEVPQTIDLVACHEQIDLCEKLIAERTDVEITIHMDPVATDDQTVTQTKTALENAVKEIDPRVTLHDFRMTPKADHRTNLIFDAVMPVGLGITKEQFKERISQIAAGLDPTYVCVITVDNDYCPH